MSCFFAHKPLTGIIIIPVLGGATRRRQPFQQRPEWSWGGWKPGVSPELTPPCPPPPSTYRFCPLLPGQSKCHPAPPLPRLGEYSLWAARGDGPGVSVPLAGFCVSFPLSGLWLLQSDLSNLTVCMGTDSAGPQKMLGK